GIPFFKLSVDPADRPEVVHIKEGNFYLGLDYENKNPRVIKTIVDPQAVFGPVTDLICPYEFIAAKKFKFPARNSITSKTPCAFLLLDLELAPGEAKTFHCLCGNMRSLETLNDTLPKIIAHGYLARKKEENRKIIAELQRDIAVKSSSPAFDLYAKQTYLDNILRGGYPLKFSSGAVFYLYSRKHGDLERDYNKFSLQPAYFSQGNGNYRDTNQNRRCDIWFHPEINEENLVNFFNLLQADGFNPLVLKGAGFLLKDKTGLKGALKNCLGEAEMEQVLNFLQKPFTPGEAIIFLEENKIKPELSYDQFLEAVISCSEKFQEAEHGEGFWTDHWAYNLDLLENYLAVYPERLKEVIFHKKIFSFFDNSETVRPRQEKYVLYDGQAKQLHSVKLDSAKKELIKSRKSQPHIVRADYGKGKIYYTTLINKLFSLAANKLASLDPFGMGIEMEAGKPNWFDALNGLPALFGSSICETFELKRLLLVIRAALEKTKIPKIALSEEIHGFLLKLDILIGEYLESKSAAERDFLYWDKSCGLKEDYRQKTRFGFSGKEIEIDTGRLLEILAGALKKITLAIDRAREKNKNIYTAYFFYEAAEYEKLGEHHVKPTRFIQKKLPLFLEAQMHALKIAEGADEAAGIYKAVKSSALYDKNLRMYKVTAPLQDMPEEIGRCRVFTPGWLENESVWLHMEYKYLLEILKQGLYQEFYAEFKNLLIPFQQPQVYGRSILENSSFIVSSAFPKKELWGNGFVARLSGSTAEFIQIWILMNAGKMPFSLDEKNELILKLTPALAGWLFDAKGLYSFNFLSRVCVTYHNPKRKDTFGSNAVTPVKIIFNDKDNHPVELRSGAIPHPYAEQVRSCQISQIGVY
ncbi:MAG: cellobiose phosphorylase, partial [Candidatus Omnitrophota bacterium]|nr:cellobiose phosphorylase [Candidatus Omnitrophota bacterium]